MVPGASAFSVRSRVPEMILSKALGPLPHGNEARIAGLEVRLKVVEHVGGRNRDDANNLVCTRVLLVEVIPQT